MENQQLIRPNSLKHVCSLIYATGFDSSSSPGIKQVTIHLKCDTITDNWVSDRRTRHRLSPPDPQSRTTKTSYPVVEKDPAANLSAFKTAIKELNRWLSPDGNPKLMLTKEIKTNMLRNSTSFSPPESIELHLAYTVVIRQDAIIFVNDVTDWVMQRSLEESAPGMVPASDSSIKLLRRTIVVDGDDDDDDGSCESCSICFEDFLAGSEVSCLPCSHVYHPDCIGKWLTTSHYCPNCRYEMPTN